MDSDAWLKHYEDAPYAVQTYLFDPIAKRQEDIAQTKLHYDYDAWKRVMDLAWEVIFGGLSRADWIKRLKPLCGDRPPEAVERETLLHVVLPLADIVHWDVESRLAELGVGEAEMQSGFRVSLRPASYGAAVRRIASKAKVSLLSEEMVRRMREILVSYLKGVRTIEQAMESMQRQQSEGGLGFSKEQADGYVAAMEDFLSTTRVMSEQDYANWFTRSLQQPPEKKPAEQATPDAAGETDVDALTQRLAQTPTVGKDSLEQATDAAMREIGEAATEEYLVKRLRNLISTRFRDVRNAIQVKAMLTRDVKVGGMGLAEDVSLRAASIIERIYAQQRGAITAEEQQRIQTTLMEQQTKIDERKKRDSEEHARWYQEKMKAMRPEEALRQQLAALREAAKTGATAATSSPQPLTPASPSLADIKAPTKLTGLNEELAGMTLLEFRRLSRTPDQAAETIKQKLLTLQRESFERWTEGMQAWRQSPLQQLYLGLVADSFKAGKPVLELLEDRRQRNKDLPTQEELGAIIALNAQLQLV